MTQTLEHIRDRLADIEAKRALVQGISAIATNSVWLELKSKLKVAVESQLASLASSSVSDLVTLGRAQGRISALNDLLSWPDRSHQAIEQLDKEAETLQRSLREIEAIKNDPRNIPGMRP